MSDRKRDILKQFLGGGKGSKSFKMPVEMDRAAWKQARVAEQLAQQNEENARDLLGKRPTPDSLLPYATIERRKQERKANQYGKEPYVYRHIDTGEKKVVEFPIDLQCYCGQPPTERAIYDREMYESEMKFAGRKYPTLKDLISKGFCKNVKSQPDSAQKQCHATTNCSTGLLSRR